LILPGGRAQIGILRRARFRMIGERLVPLPYFGSATRRGLFRLLRFALPAPTAGSSEGTCNRV